MGTDINMLCLALLAIASLAAAAPSSDRIVNGQDVTSTATAPWQASLQKNGGNFCGGSLITSKHVMSACHCKQSSGASVVLGTVNYRDPKVEIRGFFTCHPQYTGNNPNADYDFSVITLVSEVSLGENELDIAAIAIPNKEYPAGTPAQITGWGRINSAISYHPDTLQVAITELTDISVCQERYAPIRMTDRMQCVGGNGVNSACFGDSGGPLAVQDPDDGIWYLVGNTSWGTNDCDSNSAGIFSKNFEVREWINATISA